jgi:cytochrome c553
MNKTILIPLTACLVLAASVPAFAGDPAAGQRKSQTCVACHGPDGNSPAPEFPKIAGQHYDYIVKALKDYKSGARKNPIMAPMAAPLTVRDMEDLAAYYSVQKGLTLKY